MLRFLLNDTVVTEADVAADTTVLDYLRENQQLCGTKEGCASGDCGACTAVVASVHDGHLQYRSINTCITLLGSLHGQQLITVEYLQEGTALHPVQQAMVDFHGSQCGFCTPGFVMSMFAMTLNPRPEGVALKTHAEHYLGGNLCRCTGYRPIIDAAMHVLQSDESVAGKFDALSHDTAVTLAAIQPVTESNGFYRPRNIEALCELRARYPHAAIVAGGTDLSLEMTQRLKQYDQVICVQQLDELDYLTSDDKHFYIGPACSIADLLHGLQPLGTDLQNLLFRFGATQVRNQATVGGSIANASPIGDLAPVFIAMDATLVLQSVEGKRSMPMEDFFVDYRQTQLRDNEIVREVILPRPEAAQSADSQLKVYKVSKRIDDDISTVCAAFCVKRHGDVIESLCTGFGGMAAVPKRAKALERAVIGKVIDEALFKEVATALTEDFQPISDARASAEYRQQLVVNLFRRMCIETSSESVMIRVSEHV